MKEIIISETRIKTELISLSVCFLIACLSNLGAIIYYESPVIELITSVGYVIVSALVLYLIWSLMRLVVYAARKIFFKK